MATDYPLVGPASIDLRTFQSVLVAAHSPAAGEAPAMYSAIRAYGVDPAVVLAIMQHESSFGKAGIAVGRNNGFGSRYYSGAAAFGGTDRGGWAAFPNWASSAAYTAALLASPSYAGSKGANTARTFATRYAPSSDGNNPTAYGTAVVNAINRWRGEAPVTSAVPQATAKPATVAAKGSTPTAAKSPTMPTGAALGIVGLLVILIVIVAVR